MTTTKEARRRHLAKHRAWLNEIKNKPCMDCGNSFPAVCMDFDHRPGEVKKFNITANPCGLEETVLAEIAKCDLVCSNCHRIRTENRRVRLPCPPPKKLGGQLQGDADTYGCGHPRTLENSYVRKGYKGSVNWICKQCHKERSKLYDRAHR